MWARPDKKMTHLGGSGQHVDMHVRMHIVGRTWKRNGLASLVAIDRVEITQRLTRAGCGYPNSWTSLQLQYARRIPPNHQPGDSNIGVRHLLIRRCIVHPSVILRRQHAIRDRAGVPQLQLRAARSALLRRNGEGRVHLPALERRRVIGRAQGREIELQGDDGCRLEQQRACSQ